MVPSEKATLEIQRGAKGSTSGLKNSLAIRRGVIGKADGQGKGGVEQMSRLQLMTRGLNHAWLIYLRMNSQRPRSTVMRSFPHRAHSR